MVSCHARTVELIFINEMMIISIFVSFRLAALERTIESKDQQLTEINQKYQRLSEDFKYNLKLIDDRDKELATFDHRLKGFVVIVG